MSNLRTDTSLTKEKKPAASKPSRAGRGTDQISQIKNLLISYKGQMKEKKAAAPEPAPKPAAAAKQRLSNLSASNSVSKMNVSVEQPRSGQRSQEPKARLLSSIDKKDTAKAFKKKDSGGPAKEGARSSSQLKPGPRPGVPASPHAASVASMKVLKKTLRSTDNRSSAKATSSSKEPRVGRSTDASEKRTLDDSRKDLSLLAPSDQTKDSTKRRTLGAAASIRTGTSKLSLKVGIGVASKVRKHAVEKAKTEENCAPEEFQEGRYKPHTQEQRAEAGVSSDFKKKPAEKPQHKLSSVITQVRQGQMFPDSSSKKVDLDREIELISSSRSRREHPAPALPPRALHEADAAWNRYYMGALVQALRSPDEADPEVKLFKEHFFQTVQSIIFLQNVEKIDDALLVEKKVYLPPNQQSRQR